MRGRVPAAPPVELFPTSVDVTSRQVNYPFLDLFTWTFFGGDISGLAHLLFITCTCCSCSCMGARITAARCTRHFILVTTNRLIYFLALILLVALLFDNHDTRPVIGTGAELAQETPEVKNEEPYHPEELHLRDLRGTGTSSTGSESPQRASHSLAPTKPCSPTFGYSRRNGTADTRPLGMLVWPAQQNQGHSLWLLWSWMVAELLGSNKPGRMAYATADGATMDMGLLRDSIVATTSALTALAQSPKETSFTKTMVDPARRCQQSEQRRRQGSARFASATDDQGTTSSACAASSGHSEGSTDRCGLGNSQCYAREKTPRGSAAAPQGCRLFAHQSPRPDSGVVFAKHAVGGQKPTRYSQLAQDCQAGVEPPGPGTRSLRARLAHLCRPALSAFGGTSQRARCYTTEIRREPEDLGSATTRGHPGASKGGCGRHQIGRRRAHSPRRDHVKLGHRDAQGRTARSLYSGQTAAARYAVAVAFAIADIATQGAYSTAAAHRWWTAKLPGEDSQRQDRASRQTSGGGQHAAPSVSPGPSLMGPPGRSPSNGACLEEPFLGWMHSIVNDPGFVVLPMAQLLALQLAFQVNYSWWGAFLQDPRLDLPFETAGFEFRGRSLTAASVPRHSSPHSITSGASWSMDKHPAVEPLLTHCCDVKYRSPGPCQSSVHSHRKDEGRNLKRVHTCTVQERSDRRVSFCFAIDFWFPEPEQLELPWGRKPPRFRDNIPGPSILRCSDSPASLANFHPSGSPTSLEGRIPSSVFSTLSPSCAPLPEHWDTSRSQLQQHCNSQCDSVDILSVDISDHRSLMDFPRINGANGTALYGCALQTAFRDTAGLPRPTVWALPNTEGIPCVLERCLPSNIHCTPINGRAPLQEFQTAYQPIRPCPLAAADTTSDNSPHLDNWGKGKAKGSTVPFGRAPTSLVHQGPRHTAAPDLSPSAVTHPRPAVSDVLQLPSTLPFTSFDAVNRPKQLLGQSNWQEADFILRAIEASGLPGMPTGRILRSLVAGYHAP